MNVSRRATRARKCPHVGTNTCRRVCTSRLHELRPTWVPGSGFQILKIFGRKTREKTRAVATKQNRRHSAGSRFRVPDPQNLCQKKKRENESRRRQAKPPLPRGGLIFALFSSSKHFEHLEPGTRNPILPSTSRRDQAKPPPLSGFQVPGSRSSKSLPEEKERKREPSPPSETAAATWRPHFCALFFFQTF